MAKTKVQCMNCAHEFTLKSWGYDKLEEDYSFYTVCPKCKSSFNIADESAEAILISNGTKVKLFNNTIGIIDGNTFEDIDPEDTNTFENINYYVCPIEFTKEKYWSDHYIMARKAEFKIERQKDNKTIKQV